MDWNDIAPSWDAKAGVRLYAASALEAVEELLSSHGRSLEGQRALDFGCGTGLLSELLAQNCGEVVGLDPAPNMIGAFRAKIAANAWDHVHALLGTLDEALARDELSSPSFDLVVCSSVCAFVPDYPSTVRQLAELLRPGGHFVQFDWELDEASQRSFGLSREQIEGALTGAGLEAVSVTPSFCILVEGQQMQPLMGVGRRP